MKLSAFILAGSGCILSTLNIMLQNLIWNQICIFQDLLLALHCLLPRLTKIRNDLKPPETSLNRPVTT